MDSRCRRAVSALCALTVALTIANIAFAWDSLPAEVAVHYGLDGQVDGWGDKSRLLVVPAFMLACYIGIETVERHPKWWKGSVNPADVGADDARHANAVLLASMKVVLVMSLTVVSAFQVGGGPQPWFLLPITASTLVAVVVIWAVRIRSIG